MSNQLTGFTFDHQIAHGAIVRLQEGVGSLLDHREYAPDVRDLLGQAMAAMPLLATHLSFAGRINLQFQGEGTTQLLVAQVDERLRVRAMAKAPSDAAGTFAELLRGGVLALMLEPAEEGRLATQAIVPIEGQRLEQALELYFEQSEQLPTLIRLAVRGDRLGGFILQRLPPESARGTDEDWEHLRILAATLTEDELIDTDPDVLLARLFADAPPLRRFMPRPVRLECNCSRDGISRLLLSLGRQEVDSILEEQSRVEVTCEFCGRAHRFTPLEVAELFAVSPGSPSGTLH